MKAARAAQHIWSQLKSYHNFTTSRHQVAKHIKCIPSAQFIKELKVNDFSGGSPSVLAEQVPRAPHGESSQAFPAAQQPRTGKNKKARLFFEGSLKRILCRILPASSLSLPRRRPQEGIRATTPSTRPTRAGLPPPVVLTAALTGQIVDAVDYNA